MKAFFNIAYSSIQNVIFSKNNMDLLLKKAIQNVAIKRNNN